MVIGDDVYRYGLEFFHEGERVRVSMNTHFVTTVLRCVGDRGACQACAESYRDIVIDAAIARRPFWLQERHRETVGNFYHCVLGQRGVPWYDRQREVLEQQWLAINAGTKKQI